MNELSVNYQEMAWQDAVGYPSGTKIKVLRDEGDAKTVLLKLPPDFYMDKHSHITKEQHFVLEGKYESGGKSYHPGTYQFIPGHVTHGPFTSKKGAVILVIWEK